MNINSRFSDKLLASTTLNAALVPGLNTPALKGPIVASVGLDKIAENVTTDLANAADSSSHARPSMFASISSFAENVRTVWNAIAPGVSPAVYAGLDEKVKRDFAEWQGMIAAVALSNVFSGTGLSLSVDPVRLDGTDLVQRCILMEMDKDAYYHDAITARFPGSDSPKEGYLFYICQEGKPFAIYHPVVGLCAMKEYDPDIFEGVLNWYQKRIGDGHSDWTSIVEPHGGPVLLDDFCLCRIAWWAHENDMVPYSRYIQGRQNDPLYVPSASLAASNALPNAANIDNVWDGKGTAFGTTMMFYQDSTGSAFSLPELFTDSLLVAYTGGMENNKLIYNVKNGNIIVEKPICFRRGAEDLAEFAPVVPFRQSVMKLLETGSLEEINFDATVEGTKLRSVDVEVKVKTGNGETFTIRRRYASHELRQGRLPYLMIWPYVAMPTGMDLWHNYYATWHDKFEGFTMLQNADNGLIKAVSGLIYDFRDQGTVNNVYRPTVETHPWPVCTSSSPFRYALLQGKEDDENQRTVEMGMIFVPEAPEFDPTFNMSAANHAYVVNNQPVKLAIDFGTTSTVCALSINGVNEIPLPFKDYSRVITCDDDGAKGIVDVEHWLGNIRGGKNWEWSRKIFSVAQLFDRIGDGGPDRSLITSARDQDYYVDGRMFLVSGAAMMSFATFAQASQDPLLTQQIMNDMKFNETLDIKNHHAASIFLAGIYTYAVLYLLNEQVVPGKTFIELRASYPNTVTLNALRNGWGDAKRILEKVMAPVLLKPIDDLLLNNRFYNEATATTAYQRRPGTALENVGSLVSLDIGGGTTDISITHNLHPNEVKNLSLRYAGREIMVSSLIECFRRFSRDAVGGLSTSFESLWKNGLKNDPEGTANLLDQFSRLCRPGDKSVGTPFLHSLTCNSTVRMNVEMLLADGMDMEQAAITNPTNLLRQLITLKFLMVAQVTARAVRENIDMWRDPDTGELEMNNDQLEINLSVSGTSAQLLQYVFNCDMAQLSALQDPQRLVGEMRECMNLFNVIFYQEVKDILQEGQSTNLRIYIDKDIKEKREVSFGMLQPNIDNLITNTRKPKASVQKKAPAPSMSLGIGSLEKIHVEDEEDSDLQREAKRQDMKIYLAKFPQEKLETYLNGDGDHYGLVQFIKEYERIYFENWRENYGLGSDIYAISRLLLKNNYTAYYSNSRTAVSNNRAQYMIEQEQEVYKDAMACMYMVDEILDWEMASCQLN